MTIKVSLQDGSGSGNLAKINDEGALTAVLHTHPVKDEAVLTKPIIEFMSTSAGVTDMKVDGSTVNVSFSINARADKDVYIKSISFIIADAGAVLNEFGNISALSNGCVLSWSTQDLGEVIISDTLISNFEFVRLCSGYPAFGTGTSSFRASNVAGASEAFIPILDFTQVFGMNYGLRLRAGTLDKVTLTIRDNVTGVDQFDAKAYGIEF
jgi:hypothetical protein